MTAIYGNHNGLDLDNLDVTTDDEINTFLTTIGTARGPLDPATAMRYQHASSSRDRLIAAGLDSLIADVAVDDAADDSTADGN